MGARPTVVLSPDDRRLFGTERDAPIFAGARQAGRGLPRKAQPAKTKRAEGSPIWQSAGMDLDKPHDSAKAHVARAAAAIFESATDAPASSAPPT